ncbi:MAG: NAD(P)/FAD-dependent oxidoreductase [Devosia sp.]
MIIVGAGIVGMSAAYFLSQAGWHVTVLDAEAPAAGATGAADGAVSVASKKAGPLMTLAVAGADLYRRLSKQGVLTDEFVSRPTFVVATEKHELPLLERHAAQLREAGVSLRDLGKQDLDQVLGAVAPGAMAAIEVQGDGHAIGYKVVERFRRIGSFIVKRNSAVGGLWYRAGRVVGVETQHGHEPADAVLIAAGRGSASFLGAKDVIRPRKGQLIITERGEGRMPLFPGPLMSCRYLLSKGIQPGAGESRSRSFGLVIDPLQTGQFLIGGTREDSADGGSTDVEAVRKLLSEAVSLAPALASLRVLRVFAGIRAATRDGLPIVGLLAAHDNVWIATGFEGDGICLGPLIGQVCQQLICGEPLDVDISALSPKRFPEAIAA